MWKVHPSFVLPDGFELAEDSTFLYLLYEGKKIAIFSHSATPENILKECVAYWENREALKDD